MKKLLTILVLIMLIISFFQIANMYALYREQLEDEYGTLLGVWAIKVNDTDLSSGGQDLTFEITDDQLHYIESEYIEAGKIAPNGEASFDIVIDPTNTDVSIIYKINIGTITNVNIQLLSVENYFQKDGETNKVTNDTVNQDGNLYTGLIPIDKINEGYKNYVTLKFKWVNEEKNEIDSELGENEGAKLSMPISINLKQYTGEVISNGS